MKGGVHMDKQRILNHGVEYNMETFLRDMDKIMAKAEEEIKNNNVYDAREFFNGLEERLHYRVQSNTNS